MFYQRLEELREDKELLKKEMAKEIGVVESVYSEWERGKLTIPTRRIYQIANYFEVNIDYLTGLSNKRKNMKSENDINISLVSKRLKEIRKSLKLTMRDLANKLGTSSSAISNYENSKYLILSQFLIELCRLSSTSIDWVLGRTNEKNIA